MTDDTKTIQEKDKDYSWKTAVNWGWPDEKDDWLPPEEELKKAIGQTIDHYGIHDGDRGTGIGRAFYDCMIDAVEEDFRHRVEIDDYGDPYQGVGNWLDGWPQPIVLEVLRRVAGRAGYDVGERDEADGDEADGDDAQDIVAQRRITVRKKIQELQQKVDDLGAALADHPLDEIQADELQATGSSIGGPTP